MSTPARMSGFMLQPVWYNPLDKFFRNDVMGFVNGGIPETLPSVNIRNDADHYRVDMAAPGLRKEDFHIDVDRNVLVISCERDQPEEKQQKFERREYNFSRFSRRLSLPADADTERISGSYTNGILSLAIPKRSNGGNSKTSKVKIE